MKLSYAPAPNSIATNAVLLALAATAMIPSRTVLADVEIKAVPQIIDNFLEEMEIQAFLDALSTEVLEDKFHGEGEALVYKGRTPVGQAFLGRLLQAISSISTSCIKGDAVCQVDDTNDNAIIASPTPPTPRITQLNTNTIHQGATLLHKDGLCDGFTPVEDRVGLIYLNDNEDAYFQHGDARVTPQRGRMIVFAGNVLHQTIVQSGRVSLVGPFLWAPTLDCTGYLLGRFPKPIPATVDPTPAPTLLPTAGPSPAPTLVPTAAPSPAPTPQPTTKGKKKASPTKGKKKAGKGKGNLIV
jgi:hypothetical protein